MSSAPGLRPRLLSWWWDYLVILAWLVLLFIVLGMPHLLGWWDLAGFWSDQIRTDLAITLLTVVPYLLYLVGTETSPRHATWGKRRKGLQVTDVEGGSPSTRSIWVRNTIKLLPWQLAHLGSSRLATGEPGVLALVFQSASILLLVAVVGPVLAGRRGLHDALASTRVSVQD